MTFYDISLKMLREQFSHYRLFFRCNCGSTAVLFCFIALMNDRNFMNTDIVDPMISYNIYAPTVLMTIFLVIFLPITFGVFMNTRKRDYGIMMSLGMSKNEALLRVILEGVAISVMSFIVAIILGNVLSLGFYAAIIYVIRIDGISWDFSVEAVGIVGVVYGITTAFSIIVCVVRFWVQRIGTLMKAPFRVERKWRIQRWLEVRFPVFTNKHLLQIALMRRHKLEWAIRYVLGGSIIAVILFMCCLTTSMFSGLDNDAKVYAPFDLMCADMSDKSSDTMKLLHRELDNEHIQEKSCFEIEMLRDTVFNYVPVSEVNSRFGCSYRIDEGHYINLFQIEPGDGYEHDTTPAKSITIDDSNNNEELLSARSDIRILWNENKILADRTVVLNDSDYEKMQESRKYIHITVDFLRFRESLSGQADYERMKRVVSKIDLGEDMAVSAKIFDEKRAEQSCAFLVLLLVFVCLLLMFVEYILIYFRIIAEREENSRTIYSYILLGLTRDEAMHLLCVKNRIHSMCPVALGLIGGNVLTYAMMSANYNYGVKDVLICLGFGAIIALVTVVKQDRDTIKEFEILINVV